MTGNNLFERTCCLLIGPVFSNRTDEFCEFHQQVLDLAAARTPRYHQTSDELVWNNLFWERGLERPLQLTSRWQQNLILPRKHFLLYIIHYYNEMFQCVNASS